MLSKIKYRRDIQVLRGLAVLAVVLFHAKESYFPLGYLGVDVFFVISGFVVTPLILRVFTNQTNGGGLSNLKYFYTRRFYRLAPALAVTLTISAVVIFLLGPIADHERFARQGISTLLVAGNIGAYRYSGDYFSPNPNPLVHTWSLSVEEQIYILLPLLLMLILHNLKSLKKKTALLLGFISAVSCISFLFPRILEPFYSQAGIVSSSQFYFYSPIDRVWQFTVGGLAFLMLERHQSRDNKIPRGIHLLTIIAIVMILFGPIHLNLKVSSIFASLIAVTIIACKSLDMLPDILISQLEWIGDRSYSIYLVHMPLLYVAKYSPLTEIENVENRIVQSTIAVVSSILLGALSYSKIENRYRDRGERDVSSIKNIVIAIVLTVAIPLTLFVGMDIGVKKQYWGLDRNIPVPSYAGDLDPKCDRDSEIGPPCFYPNSGASKTVLLLGDSHAAHFSQAVVDAAKNASWNAVVWAHSSCHVLFQRSFKEQVSDDCLRINNEMRNWVLKNRPNVIIISQFVYSNLPQVNFRNTLLTLKSIVPNILLIENTPVFPDGKDFMIPRPLIMSAYQAPKSFKLSEMQTKDKNASNQLASWARTNAISTMNLDALFCAKEDCTRYAGSDWLYIDDNHLSVAGAALAIPKLSNFLKRF